MNRNKLEQAEFENMELIHAVEAGLAELWALEAELLEKLDAAK